MERIEDYLDENPNATMQDIENQFGTPMEIAQSYMSSLDLDVLLKRLSISRFVRRFFCDCCNLHDSRSMCLQHMYV